MYGHGGSNGSLWYTPDLDELVERDHPLRAIMRMVDETPRGMDGDFRRAYLWNGRPSGRRGVLVGPRAQVHSITANPDRGLYAREPKTIECHCSAASVAPCSKHCVYQLAAVWSCGCTLRSKHERETAT
jgi:hypothetical protein